MNGIILPIAITLVVYITTRQLDDPATGRLLITYCALAGSYVNVRNTSCASAPATVNKMATFFLSSDPSSPTAAKYHRKRSRNLSHRSARLPPAIFSSCGGFSLSIFSVLLF
ncbi:hypothetical protein NP493_119g10033 [Ridgeia piscesae]|uniref:Uncharacterized protein n=1 Tax=Ridgeia piscesae TaxID=27915 RepID=A0AAD9P6L9_RIDPI|nr:hypothetical protein NP493_119g10033 [Ridgeia piscesae]